MSTDERDDLEAKLAALREAEAEAADAAYAAGLESGATAIKAALEHMPLPVGDWHVEVTGDGVTVEGLALERAKPRKPLAKATPPAPPAPARASDPTAPAGRILRLVPRTTEEDTDG